jgi:ribokinase
MDLIFRADHFPAAGETIMGKVFDLGYGGKGANQAVAAEKSGDVNVAMVSCVGDDLFGDGTIRNFQDLGINADHVHKVPGASTGAAAILVDDNSGQNQIIVTLGANNELSPKLADAALARTKPDCIVMQCEMPLETVYHTVRHAKEHKIPTLLNVAPAQPVDLKRLDGLSYLIVNETEAKTISGIEVTDAKSATAAAKKLLGESTIGKVIVTLGEKGAILIGRKESLTAEPFKVTPIDTTGAGDAWIGCFTSSIAQGIGEQDAMDRANLYAAMSTEKVGTQKSFPDIKAFNKALAARHNA